MAPETFTIAIDAAAERSSDERPGVRNGHALRPGNGGPQDRILLNELARITASARGGDP